MKVEKETKMNTDRVKELIRDISRTLQESSPSYGTTAAQGLAAGEMEATGRIVAAMIMSESKGD